MANPTTNFGWVMPASTDLVTDLPADFATFGQGVDTSLAELKGGTTGQVLSKTSNTDMDFTWTTTDDANAIQNAIVDAKGDLIGATADNTPARLAVGTNGQVLQADSTAATGLKWATLSVSPTFVGCSVTKSAVQSAANATATTLTWDGEAFDTTGFHDNATNNSRLTIPTGKDGYYQVNAFASVTGNATGDREITVCKNAGLTSVFDSSLKAGSASSIGFGVSGVVYLVAGDYLQIQVYQNSGGALNYNYQNFITWFSITWLGA